MDEGGELHGSKSATKDIYEKEVKARAQNNINCVYYDNCNATIHFNNWANRLSLKRNDLIRCNQGDWLVM